MKYILTTALLLMTSVSNASLVELTFDNNFVITYDNTLADEIQDIGTYTFNGLDPQTVRRGQLPHQEFILVGEPITSTSREHILDSGYVYYSQFDNIQDTLNQPFVWTFNYQLATSEGGTRNLATGEWIGKVPLTKNITSIMQVTTLTNISTTSPVPVPGAVWLMGTAIAGLLVRKKIIA